MHPTLDFVFFTVSSYSFFTVLALLVTITGGYLFARKRGFSAFDSWLMLIGMSISAFIGARLFNLVVNHGWYQEDPSRLFVLEMSGFSLLGGVIFAVLTGTIISYFRKIPLMKYADTMTPFVALGVVFLRIGCFLNGCCFGEKTDLPWGVIFPPFSSAHIHQMSENVLLNIEVSPVHPTQIYELIAALLCALFAFYIIRKHKADGMACVTVGLLFSAFRLFNMQFRVLPYSWEVIHIWYPLLYVAIMLACGFFLVKMRYYEKME